MFDNSVSNKFSSQFLTLIIYKISCTPLGTDDLIYSFYLKNATVFLIAMLTNDVTLDTSVTSAKRYNYAMSYATSLLIKGQSRSYTFHESTTLPHTDREDKVC